MPLPERPLGEAIEPASHSVAIDPDQEYRIAGIYSFGRGLIKRPTISGRETAYKSMTRLHVGQLVMSKLNAWEGALAIVPEDFSGAHVSPEYPVFNINIDVADPGYIAHLVKWPKLWERLTPRGSMVRRKRTNPATLMATMVPLPALEEQRQISARVDSALTKLRKVSDLNYRRAYLVTALHESTTDVLSSKVDNYAAIGEIVAASRTPTRIVPSLPYRALGMRSFGKGIIRYPVTNGEELSKLRYFTFPENALVLSNIKAWEGAIGITSDEDTECVASSRFLFYSARDDRINLSYLRHYLLSQRGLAQISRCSPGSADRNRTLSINRFEALTIPIPQRKDQDKAAKILDRIDCQMNQSEIQGTMLEFQNSLLNAAFNNEL